MKKNYLLFFFSFLFIYSCFYNSFDSGKKSNEPDKIKSQEILRKSASKLNDNKIDEAVELQRKALELNPSDTVSYLTLASLLSETKGALNCLESLLMINNLISKDSANISLYQTKIDILRTCDFRILTTFGFLRRAYEDILSVDSTNLDALYYFAVKNQQFWINNRDSKSMKKFAHDAFLNSLQFYKTLYKNHPDFLHGIHGLTQLYIDSKQNSEIVNILNAELPKHPESVELLMDAAIWFYTQAKGKINYYQQSNSYFKQAFLQMDSVSISDYQKIDHLISGNELDAFEHSNDKNQFTQRYWRKTTSFYLHGFNEIELEHYTRVWYAKNHFFVASKNIEGDKTDRGKYYIAYGNPEKVISVMSQNIALDDTITISQFSSNDPLSDDSFASTENQSSAQQNQPNRTFPKMSSASNEKFTENYQRWFYGKYELKFLYNRIKDDYEFIVPIKTDNSVLALGNHLMPKFLYRNIPSKFKYLIESIDSSKSKMIVYYCLPINRKANVKEDFNINLEQGLFLHSPEFDLVAGKRFSLPDFKPDYIFDDENDSLYAVQKSMMIIPNGDYNFTQEMWAKNSDLLFSKKELISTASGEKFSVLIENIILTYRSLYDVPEKQLKDISEEYQFIPVFSDKIQQNETAKLFFKVLNNGDDEFHDYLVSWTMARISTGFFAGIYDVLTQKNSSTSVEFNYSHKPKVFYDSWEVDAKSLSTGHYIITLEILDKKTRKRDRKEYPFEVVD